MVKIPGCAVLYLGWCLGVQGEVGAYRLRYPTADPSAEVNVTALERGGTLRWHATVYDKAYEVQSTPSGLPGAWSVLRRGTAFVPSMSVDVNACLVIDLSGGAAAGAYPVTYHLSVPRDLLSNPASNVAPDHPVEGVRWNEVRNDTSGQGFIVTNPPHPDSFMGRLRAKTGIDIDLPSEAQWEYACRAGATNAYHNNLPALSDTISVPDPNLDPLAWYGSNSGTAHHAVGGKQPNTRGLYDLHGNVAEFCLDWRRDTCPRYTASPGGGYKDPLGLFSSGLSDHVVRGGSYAEAATKCRSARRWGLHYLLSLNFVGFRVAAPAP